MSQVFEARYYSRPADEVAEVNELKANYAAARETAKAMAELEQKTEQARIREKIFRKARAR